MYFQGMSSGKFGYFPTTGMIVNEVGVSYPDPWAIDISGYSKTAGDAFAYGSAARAFAFETILGDYVYIMSNNNIYEYHLDTAWASDRDTTQAAIAKSLSAEDASPYGLIFNSSMTNMVMLGASTDTLYHYSFGTPGRVATLSYDSDSFALTGQTSATKALSASTDLKHIYILDQTNKIIYQYANAGWGSVSGMTLVGSLDVSSYTNGITSLYIGPSGFQVFLLDAGSPRHLYQLNMNVQWDISDVTYTGYDLDVASQATVPQAVQFKPDGTRFFILGSQYEIINQYDV